MCAVIAKYIFHVSDGALSKILMESTTLRPRNLFPCYWKDSENNIYEEAP